jgi:hypothetical protein
VHIWFGRLKSIINHSLFGRFIKSAPLDAEDQHSLRFLGDHLVNHESNQMYVVSRFDFPEREQRQVSMSVVWQFHDMAL